VSDEPKVVLSAWSVAVPLAQREACPTCGHLHRVMIARVCECCRTDIRTQFEHEVKPLRRTKNSHCKVCGREVAKNEDGSYRHANGYAGTT
jgi:transcription elongation factor Elf1